MIMIRAAQKQDTPVILQFIKDLAAYEKAADEVVADVAQIERSLFSDAPKAFALIAEEDNQAIGFAVYFFSYSTWLGQYGLYLEDLYVTPEARGHGAGLALMKKLADIAVNNQCSRFEWSVLDWNDPAIQFYKSIGAEPKSEWVGYRLAGNALQAFASSPE
ncbi:GNAT family N-acetyltransferase [Marinicella sp. W31]|uniref:GNAT family N-acetyltransferase n=1 Tax=Marinicella sp. W31 TaxID=3023713 RepID=UPI0037577E95